MTRFRFGLASLVLCLTLTAPASAQSGLYEPFPSAAQSKRAERFVGKLGAPTSVSDLRQGTFPAGGLSPPSTGTATARAGVTADGSGADWFWLLAGAALAALLGPTARAAVRPRV